MLRVVRESLLSILFFASALITVFGLLPRVQPSGPDTAIAMAALAAISTYCFIAYLFYKTKYSRASKYGEALPVINEAFRSMHELRRKRPTIREYIKSSYDMCDCVAKAFSIITSSNCSASIKTITYANDKSGTTRFAVQTFARDRLSLKKREHRNVHIDHWIDKNSDFLEIFENIDTSNPDHS